MLVVLTEETTRQTYREQMFDAFPRVRFGDCLRLEFFAGSDHTFVLERDRAELTRLILDWAATLKPEGIKPNQKTPFHVSPRSTSKSFLLLFFKKEGLPTRPRRRVAMPAPRCLSSPKVGVCSDA